MFIFGISIENLRSIYELHWTIPIEKCPGWHVIIGDNGTGKSTILKALALFLVGPAEAVALRQDWENWVRKGLPSGRIQVAVWGDLKFDSYQEPKGGDPHVVTTSFSFWSLLRFQRKANGSVQLLPEMPVVSKGRKPRGRKNSSAPGRSIWGAANGWFSASFGPFRRFTGGDREIERLYQTNPKLARHLSIFGEDVALTESLEWLKQLQFAKLEGRPEGILLEAVTHFVNQPGFLPHQVKLHEVTSRGVIFRDAEGRDVPVTDLSDGYRSVLSLAFELIRQLTTAYGPDIFDLEYPDRVKVPGVVLIDEADAHLHPTWQRRIGIWFRTHFPNIQFIVTTHSPLICQAADVGTVFKLPTPGTDEKGRFIEGVELDRLIYGNILDAYGTGAFGDGVTRSDESVKRLTRLAELNFRELHGALSTEEHQEQAKLQATMPTAASRLPDANGNGPQRRGKNGKPGKTGP